MSSLRLYYHETHQAFNWLVTKGVLDYGVHYNSWLFVHHEVKYKMLASLLISRFLNKLGFK